MYRMVPGKSTAMASLLGAIATVATALAVSSSTVSGAYTNTNTNTHTHTHTHTPGNNAARVGHHGGDAPQDTVLRQICNDDPRIASILDSIDAESFGLHTTQHQRPPLPMNYNIFRGNSSLRSLSKDERELLSLIQPFKSEGATTGDDDEDNNNGNNNNNNNNNNSNSNSNSRRQTRRNAALNRVRSVLFLLKENLEVAHELVLGVTEDELDEAEYAATHPGKTSWLKDHPLDDSADWIHAIVHRLEGSALGEVDQPGYENAKYWILGGPKLLERPAADHPVRKLLARCAPRIAPSCVSTRGLLKGNGNSNGNGASNEHRVLAGGGKFRSVVPPLNEGEWDDLAFIELCRQMEEQQQQQQQQQQGTVDGTGTGTAGAACRGLLSDTECAEIADLQRFEILCLLRFELHQAAAVADSVDH